MKKKLVIVLSILILCFGCKKHEINETTESNLSNSAQLLSATKGKVLYGISAKVGHSGTNCPGCVQSGGSHFHVDCQGAGSDCTARATMEISDSGEINFYFGTIDDPDELTAEDFFIMPDRSLYIIGAGGQFLNIPEQIVYRDEETGTFVFYDIFFSESQAFENR